VSTPRPYVDEQARAALDAIELPISVTSAVRGRDGRLLDFRMEDVNVAAATWLGVDRDLVRGQLATELVPGLRSTGLFDRLEEVVRTGVAFCERGIHYEGDVGDGRRFSATFDLAAERLGDGYLSAWREHGNGALTSDLGETLRRLCEAIPVVRLEARAAGPAGLRLRPAT